MDGAEDVGQEVLIRFWEHRAEWRPRSSAWAILYTIARHLALNQRESLATRERLLAGGAGSTFCEPPSPHEWVEGRELQGALGRAISLLPLRQQEILLLSRLDGLSRAEIAEVTGLSPQTVANHLVMALKNLRKILGPLLRDS